MNDERRVTRAEAADNLGMSKQSVGYWLDQPDAPAVLEDGVRLALWPAFPRFVTARRMMTSWKRRRPHDNPAEAIAGVLGVIASTHSAEDVANLAPWVALVAGVKGRDRDLEE